MGCYHLANIRMKIRTRCCVCLVMNIILILYAFQRKPPRQRRLIPRYINYSEIVGAETTLRFGLFLSKTFHVRGPSALAHDGGLCVDMLDGRDGRSKLLPSDFGRYKNLSELRRFKDCGALISANGYKDKPVTRTERDFPLAFGMLVYKNVHQVEQLLRTIYRPHNVYCIHVDKRSDPLFSDSLKCLASCFDNVFVIREFNVVYGSISIVLSGLACMRRLVKTNVNWKYYLNLTGQEYVLKTNLEIVQILTFLRGINDIEMFPFPSGLAYRYIDIHEVVDGVIRRFPGRKKQPFGHAIPIYKGSYYGMFTRKFVHFVLESKISRDLIRWAADTYCPDEMIWATLNALPSAPGGYAGPATHDNNDVISRAVIWQWDKPTCRGIYVRSVCVFGTRDLPWLVTRPEVIANKFDVEYDRFVLDCLEEWMYSKTMASPPVMHLNWTYYKHISHFRLYNGAGRDYMPML